MINARRSACLKSNLKKTHYNKSNVIMLRPTGITETTIDWQKFK